MKLCRRRGNAGPSAASPGRKAGCGLKQPEIAALLESIRASPGRKAGCGLKHVDHLHQIHLAIASPGRKAGCGLKLSEQVR